MAFTLKEGFLLGAASAATQIEGGECDHNWNDWYRKGMIKDGSDPARADDHYNRWREDADIMGEMGLQVYRMGIEWARLCPEEGKVNEEAVAHYREEISYLRDKGIPVLLTIHHFTNPMWFEEKGGFSKIDNMPYFLNLVELVVRSFGDLVSEYITINEPNVYAVNSYFFGEWPPAEKSFWHTIGIMSNMATCHIRAYELIHTIRREMGYTDTQVSFAHHMRVFEPKNPKNLWHRVCTRLMQRFFQGAVTNAICLGKFQWPLNKPMPLKSGEYCDFLAINYYTRTAVSGFADGVMEGVPRNDLGWDIYPQGIIDCAKELYDILPRTIYITENGTCDNGDVFRCRYLYEHLQKIMESSLPIQRYYHWCFCDNFEWAEGESARFGLVHVDYESQQRTVKNSGKFYSDVIKAGGVTEEIYNTYVKDQQYHF